MTRQSVPERRKGGVADAGLRRVLRDIRVSLEGVAGADFRLILFGSHARNEAGPDSDVDLLVILPDAACTVDLRERVRDAVHEFSLRSDYLFSAMVVSESQARDHQGFQVFAAVDKEGVLL